METETEMKAETETEMEIYHGVTFPPSCGIPPVDLLALYFDFPLESDALAP